MSTGIANLLVMVVGFIMGCFLNKAIPVAYKREGESVEKSGVPEGGSLCWQDFIPVLDILKLRDRCRKHNIKFSVQYPLQEVLNGVFYLVTFLANGFCVTSVIYCLMTSALIFLSLIDFKIFIIPDEVNFFLLIIGVISLFSEGIPTKGLLLDRGLGFLVMFLFLAALFYLSGGRAIGGGDVKLMSAVGVLLGWKKIVLAFFLGCLIGSVCHVTRMKVSGADKVLAMGPYLAMGIFIATNWGDQMIHWYLHLCGLC